MGPFPGTGEKAKRVAKDVRLSISARSKSEFVNQILTLKKGNFPSSHFASRDPSRKPFPNPMPPFSASSARNSQRQPGMPPPVVEVLLAVIRKSQQLLNSIWFRGSWADLFAGCHPGSLGRIFLLGASLSGTCQMQEQRPRRVLKPEVRPDCTSNKEQSKGLQL